MKLQALLVLAFTSFTIALAKSEVEANPVPEPAGILEDRAIGDLCQPDASYIWRTRTRQQANDDMYRAMPTRVLANLRRGAMLQLR